MAEQRKFYRVFPVPSEELSVELRRHRFFGDRVPGRIMDISMRGLAVYFGEKKGPTYNPRATVTLDLISPSFKKPLRVKCVVRHRKDIERGQVYGFEFVRLPEFLSSLPQELKSRFNRRGGDRVEPECMVEVVAEAATGSWKIAGILRELSSSGLSFITQVSFPANLREVKVSFRLPKEPEILTLDAEIRRREYTGDCSWQCGVAFDPNRTEDFKTKQEALARYVNDLLRKAQWDAVLRTLENEPMLVE